MSILGLLSGSREPYAAAAGAVRTGQGEDLLREVVLEAVAHDVDGDDDPDEPLHDDGVDTPPTRPEPVTLHRFARRRAVDPDEAPRRLVILRDARHRRRRDDGPPQD